VRVLDLFSGIGGFSLGLERAGMTTVAFCENDPFCRQVLAKHWPGVPILEDVTTAEFPAADVVCGGFPCQDLSSAGSRAGLSGERSGLYRELVRAFRVVRPTHAIMENVADLLHLGLGTVLGDVAESGFDAEWDCVPARALGAPHERDRIWIVAHANGEWGLQQEGPQQAQRQRFGDGSKNGSASGPSDTESERRGQGRPRRPPDSFARIRDEARRNAADPYGARLAFREGLGRDAWEERQAAKRDADQDVGQSIWPDEPALSGVDDEIPDWAHRVKATGNALIPYIPELIGRAIMEAKCTGAPEYRAQDSGEGNCG
jgi:DNA (cytosine-5)-methyltransferase 1